MNELRDKTLEDLLALLRSLVDARPGRLSLEVAEVELWRLWRREQGRLLREASRLAGSARDRAQLARWRRAARQCAGLCAADGYPVARLLQLCLARPLGAWPSDGLLARAAARRGA